MHQFDVETSQASVLCQRCGPRPRSSGALPFHQLDQWPPAEIHARLVAECAGFDGVGVRESRMASPSTRALYLPDEFAEGPPEAFIDAHEFCHLHSLPEGTIHLALPEPVLSRAVALGWAERHPLAASGIFKTLVMVYAPRNAGDLEVVLGLIQVSYGFARHGVAWYAEASHVA
jgi:hypothetical protein